MGVIFALMDFQLHKCLIFLHKCPFVLHTFFYNFLIISTLQRKCAKEWLYRGLYIYFKRCKRKKNHAKYIIKGGTYLHKTMGVKKALPRGVLEGLFYKINNQIYRFSIFCIDGITLPDLCM